MTPETSAKLDATLDAAEATIERAKAVLRRDREGETDGARTPISRTILDQFDTCDDCRGIYRAPKTNYPPVNATCPACGMAWRWVTGMPWTTADEFLRCHNCPNRTPISRDPIAYLDGDSDIPFCPDCAEANEAIYPGTLATLPRAYAITDLPVDYHVCYQCSCPIA